MRTRKINYDSTNYSGETVLNKLDALDLFQKIEWKENGDFFTLFFGDSFLQFIYNNPNILKVEIMLNEEELLIATKTISREEALMLIDYYYENDKVGDISTFEQINL